MDSAHQYHTLGFCKWVSILRVKKIDCLVADDLVLCPIIYFLQSPILTVAFWILDAKQIVRIVAAPLVALSKDPQSPSHPLTNCPYSHPRKSAASLKNLISACGSGIYSRGYWHVGKEGRVFVLWVKDGWWGITTLTKLMLQFVAAHFDSHGFTSERGFWRQVRFSVSCFGGSVLRFRSFVRGRLWPGRKLTRRCHFFGERIPEEAWSDSSDVWGLTHGRGCFVNERLGLHIRRSS